ncbi:MAG: NUDIX hydrolase [Flammeovirgaceae bacterium]|nr:NUDIX hydrolase [Flammeovirgaceae bacterium]MBE63659.1 NUDIX hydrolase [Flammeovirgaceae bacterium]MBR09899.1 NUDIX hydrolase [Rickettsiales bacterium]|tara:strand:- start:5925 stop:6437 length:513 start_codon:yes stop_codon:yes gene_type:complete
MLKNMEESASKRLYENKVRVRVCGILVENETILLLKHEGIGNHGFIWSPPGGGLEFNEDVPSTLIREFKEETNLDVEIDKFLFVNEYQSKKHHAIELFFRVIRTGGTEELGNDPEVPDEEQILTELKWISFEELKSIPKDNLHNIFHELDHPRMIVESTGFYKFESISKN